jgi:hypothetical protein
VTCRQEPAAPGEAKGGVSNWDVDHAFTYPENDYWIFLPGQLFPAKITKGVWMKIVSAKCRNDYWPFRPACQVIPASL